MTVGMISVINLHAQRVIQINNYNNIITVENS